MTIAGAIRFWAISLALGSTACGEEERPPERTSLSLGGASHHGPQGNSCQTPNDGCPCNEPGDTIDCGVVYRYSGDYLTCSYGIRTCGDDSKWGECIGDLTTTLPIPGTGPAPQALGSNGSCDYNPCDPFCSGAVDTGSGLLTTPDGLLSTDEGLTLDVTGVGPSTAPPCASLEITPSTDTVRVTALPGAEGGTGLKGEYFDRKDSGVSSIPSGWSVRGERLDSTVDFDWGNGSPGVSGIGNDNYSVRWTGQVVPDETSLFRIHAVSDDGVRVWLDGSLIIDRWRDQAPTEVISSWIPLLSGESYDIRMEYYEAGGGAFAGLYWSTATNTSRRTIPTQNLRPPGFSDGFVTDPAQVTFTAALEPSDCFEGTPEPAWTLDRFDFATISEAGVFKVFDGLGGEVEAQAYMGELLGSSTINVEVDIVDDSSAPSGAVSSFQNASNPTGADPAEFLYPYEATVFPLGLQPPLIQYDRRGSSASAVKLTLRWPSTGTPLFEYAIVSSESSSLRVEIPTVAWKAFEQTAKGTEAAIVLQRIISGSVRREIVRPIVFANAALRGNIYYTQYQRPANVKVMVADPGSDAPAKDAYGTSSGCPVCHTVSAQGNMLVSADSSWGSDGGFSEILDSGLLDPLSDHPGDSKYKVDARDWRGFAWSPLTPDGKYALATNNIWGNATSDYVGINTSNDSVSVPNSFLSGSVGTGLLAEYFSGTNWNNHRWAKFVPFVNFDFNNGGPGGPIGSNFSARYSGQVVPYFSEDYTFEVRSTGGVRLDIDGVRIINDINYNGNARARTATVSLTAGQPVSIVLDWRDPTTNAELSLEWGSPSTPFGLIPTDMLLPDDGVHGVVANFYNSTNYSSSWVSESLEPSIDVNFGSGSPMGTGSNRHSIVWTGQIEAPSDEDYQLCVTSRDSVRVDFSGSTVINKSGNGTACSSALSVNKGDLDTLMVRHANASGDSYIDLRWQSSSYPNETVSGAYLYPPADYEVPAEGLLAAYYDGSSFTTGLGSNPSRPGAMVTYVDGVDANWGTVRPNYSVLTSSDSFSVRYVGNIILPCDGVYEFESVAQDDSSLWVGANRLVRNVSGGTAVGAAYFTAGTYEFKYQQSHGSGNASAEMRWMPRCLGNSNFTDIPSSVFEPVMPLGTTGYVQAGGENTGRVGYSVWESPRARNVAPRDVTADTPGNWGMGLTTMMVPSFAPDGSKLVYVDGDQSGGAGWRKGLSVFNFDQDAKLFSERRNVVNTWPYGDVVKWPVFESDSRSILYQASTPWDWCCKFVNPGWSTYGGMSPTSAFEQPGQLYSVDSEAAEPTPTELKILNEGERPEDANKAYQPTMLPGAAAGYRWVVFTSTRPYGNVLNNTGQRDYSNTENFTQMVNNQDLQSMLWVAAVDDEPSGETDRSHPAFFLPSQAYTTNQSSVRHSGHVNERAFWALDACRPTGSNDASLCEVDEDCCGGTGSDPSAVCRLDTPVTAPPVRHCKPVPSGGSCVPNGEGCGSSADCCLGNVCLGAVCAPPPPIVNVESANFTRVFQADCAPSEDVVWRFFDWKAETPGDSTIEFYAESADDPDDFFELPKIPEYVTSTDVVGLASVSGTTASAWVGSDVSAQLDAASKDHREYLQVTMRLAPGSSGQSPILTSWRQSYDCLPDQ